MTTDLACPVCGAELDVGVLFAHETDQRALARLAAVSIPLGARVMQYVALFTPPKTRLSTEEGGRNFYLGKGLRYRASLRDREMYERFNGRNYNELAREYHLTPTRVRQIMDAMHQDDISRRQGRLVLE